MPTVDVSDIQTRGLVLLGCGKMGSAMLEGWLAQGLEASSVYIQDPHPSARLLELESRQGLHLNTDLPPDPVIVLIAVKPQMMNEALPRLAALGAGKTLFLSVAAGTSIATYEHMLGESTPIIRAMPNTPAAIGQGITAIIGNAKTSATQLDLAQTLLSSVGQVIRLDDEAQMDAVTAVSGSGPAYVFHLIETLALAGESQGLSSELALKLATATVAGAGALAKDASETPAQLRENVTSPGGTTQAALQVLMDPEHGFAALLHQAVTAAAARSQELSQELSND